MQLSYRGQHYQSPVFCLEGTEFQTNSVYRGVFYQLKSFSANICCRPVTLQYRGVEYLRSGGSSMCVSPTPVMDRADAIAPSRELQHC